MELGPLLATQYADDKHQRLAYSRSQTHSVKSYVLNAGPLPWTEAGLQSNGQGNRGRLTLHTLRTDGKVLMLKLESSQREM